MSFSPGSRSPGSESGGDGEWRVGVTNLVQVLIGAAYGFVDIEAVTAAAKTLHEPVSLVERVHVHGLVFGTLRRRLPALSASETTRLVSLVDEIARTCEADLPAIVRELRRLMGLDGPSKAEEIRDIIDRDYRTKLTSNGLARAVGLGRDDAAAEFERHFEMSMMDYLARRRALEGLALVRSGAKIESAARDVGFGGTRHFYAAVRKLTGTTPAAHRGGTGHRSHTHRERERERERDEP